MSYETMRRRLDRLAALNVTPAIVCDEMPGGLFRLPDGREVDAAGLRQYVAARGVGSLIVDDIRFMQT
jgi:hypothetical protein